MNDKELPPLDFGDEDKSQHNELPPLDFGDSAPAVNPLKTPDGIDDRADVPFNPDRPQDYRAVEDMDHQAELEAKHSVVDSAWHGAVNNLPFLGHFVDETSGGAEALGSLFGVRGLGEDVWNRLRWETPEDRKQSFKEIYKATRDAKRQEYDDAYNAHPVAYGTGAVAGVLGSGAIGSGPAALNITKADTLLPTMAKGALGGAIQGVGASNADTLSGVAGDAAIAGGAGAVAAPAVKYVIEPLARGVAKLGARALGKSFDDSQLYLDNADKVNHPDNNFEAVEDRMKTGARRVFHNQDEAEFAYKEAQDVAKSAQQSASANTEETWQNINNDYKNAAMVRANGYNEIAAANKAVQAAEKDAAAALAAAQQAFDSAEKGSAKAVAEAERQYANALKVAKTQYVQSLKDTQIPHEAITEAKSMIDTLTDRMKSAAAKQRATLPQGVAEPMDDVTSWLDTEIESQRDHRGLFDPANPKPGVLRKLRDRLVVPVQDAEGNVVGESVPEMTPEELLNHRQNTQGGAFTGPDGRRIKGVDKLIRAYRERLNQKLDALSPGDPANQQARAELGQAIQQLDNASELFGGSQDQVRRRLEQMASPKYAGQTATINELEKASGRDVSSKVRDYIRAKQLGANPEELHAAFMGTNPATAEQAAMEQVRQAGTQEIEAARAAIEQARQAGASNVAAQQAAASNTSAEAAANAKRFEEMADEAWLHSLKLQRLNSMRAASANNRALAAQAEMEAARKATSNAELVVPRDALPTDGAQSTMRKLIFANKNKPQTSLRETVSKFGQDIGDPDLAESLDLLALKNRMGIGGANGSRRAVAWSNWGSTPTMKGVLGTIGAAIDLGPGALAKLQLDAARMVPKAYQPIIQAIVTGATSDPAMMAYARALNAAMERGPEAVTTTVNLIDQDMKKDRAP